MNQSDFASSSPQGYSTATPVSATGAFPSKPTSVMESMQNKSNKELYVMGLRDGIPIGLGYFAVAFSLGIAAKQAGLTALQGFLASFLCNASAGEYAGFALISAGGSYLEMVMVTLIANARYLLMSCALSQRFSPQTGMLHRVLIGFDLTDEIFGLLIARPIPLTPAYAYGAMSVAIPSWAFGTAAGILVGSVLPARVVSALSVALFGMFLAIIIPPAKENRVIGIFVLLSFVLSGTANVVPLISALPSGTKIILLTVGLSCVAAHFFPVSLDELQSQETEFLNRNEEMYEATHEATAQSFSSLAKEERHGA